MPYDNEGGESIPPHHIVPHYHGHTVRVIFVIEAVVLIVAQSTGAELPLSTFGAVASAVVLVVAAGITHPRLSKIHWLNAFLAVFGTLLFGMAAVEHYRSGLSLFDPSFTYVEALALLSLVALYLTTRTIRGLYTRSNFS